VQINYDYYEDLTVDTFSRILDELAAGRVPRPGPQVERQFSAPPGGLTTLTDPNLYAQSNGRPRQEPALTDAEPKKPGEAANVQERPAPKPPAADASAQAPPSERRE
jgi:NADH-quinone oxidoreductase subunit E